MALFNINVIVKSEDTCLIKDMYQLLLNTNIKLNTIMATITELTTKVDELQVALDLEQAQIAEAIAGLEQSITDLTALVAEGGTAVERQALADKLQALKEDLEGTISDTVVETTTETTTEEVTV